MKTKRKCSKAQLAALAKGRAKLARMRSQKGGSPVDALTEGFESLSINDPVVKTEPTAVGSEVKNKGRSTGTRVSPCCAALLGAAAAGAAAAGYGSVNTRGPFAYTSDQYPVDCGVMDGYVPMNTVAKFLQNPYDDIEVLESLCGPSIGYGATCTTDGQGAVFYKLRGEHPCAELEIEGNELVIKNPKENQKKTKKKIKTE